MKKYTSFWGKLFGTRKPADIASPAPRQIMITAYSQPHVLQQRMKDERLTHGETVMANLSPVRLEVENGRMVLYFCPMRTIEILETVSDGDGGAIPGLVKVDGLVGPDSGKPGFYSLKNVTLTSNGTMQVKATEQTQWEVAEPDIVF
jgi:hypothetical protein